MLLAIATAIPPSTARDCLASPTPSERFEDEERCSSADASSITAQDALSQTLSFASNSFADATMKFGGSYDHRAQLVVAAGAGRTRGQLQALATTIACPRGSEPMLFCVNGPSGTVHVQIVGMQVVVPPAAGQCL